MLPIIALSILWLLCIGTLQYVGLRKLRHRPNYEYINSMSRQLGIEPLTETWKGEPLEDKTRTPMPQTDYLARKTEEQYEEIKREQIRSIYGEFYDPMDLDNIIPDDYKWDGM